MQHANDERTTEEILKEKREIKRRQKLRYILATSLHIGDRVKIVNPESLLYWRDMDEQLQGVIATVCFISNDPKDFYCVTIQLPDLGIYLPDSQNIRVNPEGLEKI
jgi:hypothetical protein